MDTIPIEKEFVDAIEDIVELLRKKDYSKVVRLPYVKGNIFSIINDLSFFVRKKDGIFKSSFLYDFRRNLFNDKDLITLCDFFMHNKEVTYSRISSLLGKDKVKNLMKLNIFSEELDEGRNMLLRSRVRVITFDGEYFICDPFDRTVRDFVWLGSDSILLAARLKRLKYAGKLAIDIGTGSGIQAIALSTSSNNIKIIAIDINEKALRYGKLNAIINKKTNIHFVKSDMLSAIRNGVDIIVSNPPYLFLPRSQSLINRDGYGGMFGLEKIIYILKNLPQYLNPGGKAILLTLSPIISGKNILIEEIKKLFEKNYVINYDIVDYVYDSEFKNLYDSKNISYFIQGILEISKYRGCSSVQISIKDMPKIRKLLSFTKIIGKKLL